MRLAVIPARGGSKRIPRKNVRDFCGKPMIAWSIEAAHASACFDRVVVSTDDSDIAQIATHWGAEVPFNRPAALADDFAGTIPVVQHATQWALEQGLSLDAVCCIYATAPFVRAADIRQGLSRLLSQSVDYAFSATDYGYPVQRAFRLLGGDRVEMLNPQAFGARSQDLETVWHDAGQFYWGRVEAWLEQRVFFSPDSVVIPLPRHRVQDIDTEEDWLRAELIHGALQARGS